MTAPILVWGAGAIGGSLGAAFIRAGRDVVFVDAALDHVAALNTRGLTITGPVAPSHVEARAFAPAELTGTFEQIVLAVKSHHTPEALDVLVPHLAPDGYVLSAQNGLEERRIAARIGESRTLGCFVNFGADYLEPGVILYGGRGAVVVGEIDGTMTPRLEGILELFRTFEPNAIKTPNIWGYLWAKLVYGSMLFATALTNDSIADVLALTKYRPMLVRLAHEVQAVARAEGVKLEAFNGFDPGSFAPEAGFARADASFDEMVAFNRRSAKSHSGIWRDLAIRKRRTEVDAQLGPIVEIGRRHAIPTPIVEGIIIRIHEVEDGKRELSLVALAELDALSGKEDGR